MDGVLDKKHTGMMLAVVFFATFMDGLDGSIVNVALPDIGNTFKIDTATVSWATITYMMVLAGTLVAFARIAEDTGVKRIMAGGLMIFTLASLACGLSPSFWVLIISRAVQAVGAGMMAATGPMCCVKHLPPEKLAFGLSLVTIGASVGFAIGPAIGGFIIEYISWHWIFLINLPLGAISIPLMLKAIPRSYSEGRILHLDKVGTAVLFAAIVLVTFSIETMSYSGMLVISITSAILGLVLLFTFVKIERKTEHPLLELGMFRRWDFTTIFACLMLVNMVFMGMLYLIPFYGEICLDMSSLTIGLFLLVSSMVTAILGLPFGKLSDRKGRKPFCVSAGILSAAAFFLFYVFVRDMSTAVLFVCMVLMGISWACVGGPMASRLVEHAGDERGMASSLTNEAYYIGGAIGTALAAMSFTLFSNTGGIDIQNVSSAAFMDGFGMTALLMTAMSLVLSLLSALVRDRKDQ